MITFHFAVDACTSLRKLLSCAWPSIVRLGSLIVSRHCCDTGLASDGISSAKTLRVDWGAVGARSGAPVLGLLHVPPADALALRNERSSRKNISRFWPQRKLRYSP